MPFQFPVFSNRLKICKRHNIPKKLSLLKDWTSSLFNYMQKEALSYHTNPIYICFLPRVLIITHSSSAKLTNKSFMFSNITQGGMHCTQSR